MAGRPKKEQPKVEETKAVKVEEKEQPKVEETKAVKVGDSYIMKVTHLSWGYNNKNHFYAKQKPLINAKVLGKYSSILKVWLTKGWIEKGSYKK